MKNGYLIIGWVLLAGLAGFKALEYGLGADWVGWSDSELILVLAFTALHLFIGWVKGRREEDQRRARFL